MPKVSVIVPVYNSEKYLRDCLESLVNQTLDDIEIICINDGSKDKSVEILKEYKNKDSRIVIIDQLNQGVSAARNNALKIANGEYIGFVDSDDWVDTDYFESMYNAASKNDCDSVICGFEKAFNKDSSGKKYLKFKKEKIYSKTADKYNISDIFKKAYLWNKIYKRSVINDLKLEFPPVSSYEDMMFNHIFLHKSNKMVTVPNIYYHYRINEDSLVHSSQDENKIKDFKSEILKSIAYVKENRIKVNRDKYYPQSSKVIKFLGIPILRIKTWEDYSVYYLFRIFPILTITTKKFF